MWHLSFGPCNIYKDDCFLDGPEVHLVKINTGLQESVDSLQKWHKYLQERENVHWPNWPEGHCSPPLFIFVRWFSWRVVSNVHRFICYRFCYFLAWISLSCSTFHLFVPFHLYCHISAILSSLSLGLRMCSGDFKFWLPSYSCFRKFWCRAVTAPSHMLQVLINLMSRDCLWLPVELAVATQ